MLKGKRILTENYFGTVLNDAEKEPCVIVRVIRWRKVWYNSDIAVTAGLQRTEVSWHVSDEVKAVPWNLVGEITICEHLPKWLHLRSLRRSGRGHAMRRIKGRNYIDW